MEHSPALLYAALIGVGVLIGGGMACLVMFCTDDATPSQGAAQHPQPEIIRVPYPVEKEESPMAAFIGPIVGGLALLAVLIGVVALQQVTGYAMRSECHTVQPYGQHDQACIYYIGR